MPRKAGPRNAGDSPGVKCSDGVERFVMPRDPVGAAIGRYFAEKQDERILQLKWDNEYMREQLRAKAALHEKKLAAAAAGGHA